MTGTHDAAPKVAIVGSGVIGAGWAARFLLHGWDVHLFDTAPGAFERTNGIIENARRALPALADAGMPPEGRLTMAATLHDAVEDAKWIQESVPERIELKHKVISEIEAAAPPDAFIASSTSGFTPSSLQQYASSPARILVAHPFNPVYLLPLVEVVPSQASDENVRARAKAILTSIGMKPLVIRHEIEGHIADRLLEAVWREALWLINDDVATTSEIDDAICFGFGLRWAQMGLFETYRLAGGDDGMEHFIRQFGPALKWPWTKLMDVPDLNDQLVAKLVHQSLAQGGGLSVRELEWTRDDNLVAIMRALKRRKWGAGLLLNEHDRRLADMSSHCSRTANISPKKPLRMLERSVPSEWLDYNDHMTEHRYLQAFGETTDAFLQHIGLDSRYLSRGHSYYTVETHITYLKSVALGEEFYVTAQVIEADSKRLRLLNRMHRTRDDVIVSQAEHLLLHVNTKSSRVCAAEQSILQNLMPLAAAHSMLDRSGTDGSGRVSPGSSATGSTRSQSA